MFEPNYSASLDSPKIFERFRLTITPYRSEKQLYREVTGMKFGMNRRFRRNLLVILSVVVFSIGGLAVSQVTSSESVDPTNGAQLVVQPTPKSFKPGVRSPKAPLGSESIPGRLLFGRGYYFSQSLNSISNVGTSNDVEGLAYTNEHLPVFSPDGNSILFTSFRDGAFATGLTSLYRASADGFEQIRLTANTTDEMSFTFSPDSSKIVYTFNEDLWKMNADGSNKVLLADLGDRIRDPQFSPDGATIIFNLNGRVWKMNADGSGQSEFGTEIYAERARFSPDGTKVIYSGSDEVYVVDADGTNNIKLIDDDNVGHTLNAPTFSPDGTKILMNCYGNEGPNICTSNADGTDFRSVSVGLGERTDPVWAPDSLHFAFVERNNSTNEYSILLSTIGGTPELIFAGESGGALAELAWQPVCIDIVPTPTPTPTTTPTPLAGLISEWNANDGTADDAFGDNDGSFQGDAALVDPGKVGYGFVFFNDGGYINIPDSESLDVQTGDYTLSTWFAPTESAEHYVAGKGACGGDSNSNFYIGVDELNRPFIDISHTSGGSRIGTGIELTSFEFHHLLLKKQGTNYKLFIDGIQEIDYDQFEPVDVGTQPFTIGKGDQCISPQLTAKGYVDEVRLYGRALTTTEIDDIFQGSSRPANRNLLVCQPTPDPAVKIKIETVPTNAGRNVTFRIQVKDGLPPGDVTVDLTSTDPNIVSVPPTVTLPSGQRYEYFQGTTTLSNDFRNADIIATLNTEQSRATVTVAPAAPDVVASNLAAPPVVNVLQNFTASWTVTNSGQAATNAYRQDSLYISTDDVLFNDVNDRIVGRLFENGAAIQPGATRNVSLSTANIPAQYIPTDGLYYLFVYVGDGGTVQEGNQSNYGNNFISIPIQVNRNLPDLIVQNLTGPAVVEPNVQYHTVSWEIKNAGSAATSTGFQHHVFYSFDTVIGNSDDMPLTYRGASVFAVGEVQSFSQQFDISTLPVRSSSDGLFYVRVDPTNLVYEDDPGGPAEVNNVSSIASRFEYRVPDVRVASVTPPVEVESDTQFDLAWTTKNFGNRTSPAMNERVYFSTDNVVSGNDPQIGDFYLSQQLAPDQSVDRIQQVSIPTNAITATGNYYVYVKTDSDGNVNEGANENNNITFQQVRVRRLLRPDLRVTIAAPATAFFGQEVQVQWTVTNHGAGPTNSPNWQDVLYINGGQTLNGATGLATRSNASFLAPGESYISTATVRIPRGISGSFYFAVRTDAESVVNEEIENNNITYKATTINIPTLPDLRTTNVQAPIEAFGGSSMLLSWTVTNNGTATTPIAESTWSDAIYLSRDAVLSGDDRYVGKRQRTGELAVNGSYTVSGYSAVLPGDVFGDYYVFVVADIDNQLYEFNAEGNNSDYDRISDGSPLHVLGTPPDLTVLNPIIAPTSANAGQTINVQFTVRNQGAFDASGLWTDNVYISADQTLDPANDILIASSNRVGLLAGQQYGNNLAAAIPNCLNGTYYLFAVTDSGNRIFEFDVAGNAEANNVSQPKAIQLTNFAPDLRVTEMTVPPIVINGAMPITWKVKNLGTAATTQTNWTDRIYLINGTSIVHLGYFDHFGALAINGEYTQNQIVYIPLFLEGEFTIVIQADASNNVPECSFELNNNDNRLTQVNQDLPDLRIGSINAPSTAQLGTSINVSWNAGNYSAPMSSSRSWADSVYLSSNQTLDQGDQILGGIVKTAVLGSGQGYSSNGSFTIPNIAAGNYYLIVNADNGNNVVEGVNETNNATVSVPITLTSPLVDLVPSVPTAAPILYSGQYTDVSWTVTNNGVSPTINESWMDHVVLSRDLVYDPSDILLEYRQHNGVLANGAGYTENSSVRIPAGLTGEYKILVIADKNNSVVESNDVNNISTALTVELQLPPPAELNVSGISVPANAILGEDVTLSWTVQNSSLNTVSGLWQDTLYFSTDQTWDSGDILVGQQARSNNLGPNSTYTGTMTMPMPAIETGNYYVIVRTDSRNTIRESDETNNVTSSGSQTAVSIANLTLGNALTTSLVTGQERYYSILNLPADETMLITLDGENGSRNELYTRSNTVVSRSNYEFQGKDSNSADQENIVPNTVAGNYYTMARGDYVPSSFAAQLKKADKDKAEAAIAAQAVIIKAQLLPFGIRTVSPVTAGNKGYTFVNIDGAKFAEGATVQMVGPGGVTLAPINTIYGGTTNVKALFDLNDKPVGNYQITLTNPNAQASTWSTNFVITNGGGYQITSEVTGPGEVRAGPYYRYTVTTRNQGKNDAIGVAIIIAMSLAHNYRLSTSNLAAVQSEGVDQSAIPNHLDIDGKRFIFLYAPVVRSNESVNIGIDVSFVGTGTITATSLPPLFSPNFVPSELRNRQLASASPTDDILLCYLDLLSKTLLTAFSEIFPADCAGAVISQVYGLMQSAFSTVRTGFDIYATIGNVLQSAVNVAVACAKNLAKYIPWIKVLSLLYDLYQLSQLALECVQKTFEYVFNVRFAASIDPNEKLGPVGSGPERWVPKDKPLLYRINFENKPEATAPAQKVRIVDQLPPTLDPRTLRLVEMGFKQYRVEVPANRAFYQTRLQLGADLDNLKADISAGLDIANGRVTWNFTAIDPETGEQPLAPSLGILPPNNSAGDGEGYVIFSIEPTDGQPVRTDLANKATIYFDDNEPIITNLTTNLLDPDVPSSQMSPIAPTSESTFIPLSWTGSDVANGSGLSGFDIMVSENDGPYTPFVANTTDGGGTFNARYGRTYRFYSVARDNAGNVEPAPETPDATVTILGGAYEGDVASRPNGNNDGTVNGDDATQIRRFAAKVDTGFQYNEFQRADTAPIADGGDGEVSVADVVQANRYAIGFDTVRFSTGPLSSGTLAGNAKAGKDANLLPRAISPRILFRNGNTIQMAINLEAQGGEVGAGFTMNYDTTHLSNPRNIVAISGASVVANTSQAGKVGIVIDKLPSQPFAAGTQQIVTLEFDVNISAPAQTQITFDSDQVKNEVVDATASSLITAFDPAMMSLLAPTASNVSISGKVTSRSGKPIKDTIVFLTDDQGFARRTVTSLNGTYRFENVESGRTYILNVRNKTFRFAQPTRVVSVSDIVENADFVTME